MFIRDTLNTVQVQYYLKLKEVFEFMNKGLVMKDKGQILPLFAVIADSTFVLIRYNGLVFFLEEEEAKKFALRQEDGFF